MLMFNSWKRSFLPGGVAIQVVEYLVSARVVLRYGNGIEEAVEIRACV